MRLKVLDLFSGIGGFSLGLERTGGFETVAFCEIEPFPRKVLAKHWPGVPCYHDIRTLTKDILDRDGIAVDVICGGFPCQDISTAGKGGGITGARSGLWKEYARLIGELQPGIAIMENVSALLSRGIDVVLGDLAEIGYDAEWDCIPASAVGAPHRRDRIWIVAYPGSFRRLGEWIRQKGDKRQTQPGPWNGSEAMANANEPRLEGWPQALRQEEKRRGYSGYLGAHLGSGRRDSQWSFEPNVGRVADGVPDRSHRIKALGNAVVPQIPELIGNAILQWGGDPCHADVLLELANPHMGSAPPNGEDE